MEALGINLGYLVSQIVNFTILALVLYAVAYKPILRMMDERRDRIAQGIKDSEEASHKAAQAQEAFEQQVAEARRESQNIIAQASTQGEKVREEILAEAKREAEERIERAKAEIRLEREQALAELQAEIADLSIMITGKVLGEVVDEQAQRRLISEFLEETDSL